MEVEKIYLHHLRKTINRCDLTPRLEEKEIEYIEGCIEF